MSSVDRAVQAVSDARDLCLSLERAFAGPHALELLRAGRVRELSYREIRIGLGLAWAAGDVALVRAALSALPADRVGADSDLAALRDASR